MKASDKLKAQLQLKEKQIEQIQNIIVERNGILGFKDNPGTFGKSEFTGKERYYNYRTYYVKNEKVPKSEFEKNKTELDKLHEKDHETLKQLDDEIILLRGALERALANEANLITVKNKNSTSRSYDFWLHHIITIVSKWKNIEGDYSQSKLAVRMNKGRWFITRLFAEKFTYYEHEKTFKKHLIDLVRNAIEHARESKDLSKMDRIPRLKHFLRCLTKNDEVIKIVTESSEEI